MTGLLIYTPEISLRLKYIVELFFDSIIKTPFLFTADGEAFRTYDGPKLNYSATVFSENEVQIVPHGLLTETGIKAQSINVSEWGTLKIFFQSGAGSLPFDIFSASFFLVSRYEEYFVQYSKDKHNRFRHQNSLAYKNHFLDVPLVNLWAEELKKVLLAKYPSLAFSNGTYSFIPTVDVDIAYAHLGRSLAITLGSIAKAITKFDFRFLIEKKLVLLRLKKDPYDTFGYQEKLFQKYNLRPIYFILAGQIRGAHDKNISSGNSRMKRLLAKLSTYAEVGIHPSYRSESNAKIVAQEIKSVEQSIPGKITCSRQHFLRINLPQTYRCLVELGITDDYTMIHAGALGFRASICTPFFFYDLQAEEVLPVKVHSSAVMDGMLKDYLRILPQDAPLMMEEIISKTKKCNGEFIPILHNHSLDGSGHWKDWKQVFEGMIESAV